jgi:hypothetical protein
MRAHLRSWAGAGAAVLALVTAPGALALIYTPAAASADVCANAGRRVSVGGCVDVAGAIADYAPPPAYYAPLPEDFAAPAPPPPPPPPGSNINGCVGFNGRRVSVSGCN